ncbi:MAG TPA: AMIN domain-containing protein [Nostocaceae cyanobacterium]|nr:AMIN domain-containing protein [Nostocaceae cyanobacterium]
MKQVHGKTLISGAAAAIVLAAQPAYAQTTEITGVQLNPVEGGISVMLQTGGGSERPQIFTTQRGKSSVADIINTQLRLPQGNGFRQDNPTPGIASVEVTQLDGNSVRVTVTGSNDAPTSQPVTRAGNGLTLGFTSSSGATASAAPTTPTTPTASTPTGAKPEVLVPNPEVTIDGKPAQPAGPGQPFNQAPPFLPRAVAPPVGDIAVSNVDTSPSTIDLGTQERVPRLVLREAPVREVLSLLARAAGMNLAYAGNEGTGNQQPGSPNAQRDTSSNQTISLDIENEPVQDVFNYVLRLSGLEANRSGRTIFVAPKLPNSTRDVIMRSLRLNQVTVGVAINFLVGLGAESAVSRERPVTSVSAVPVGAGAAPITQTQTTTETRIETQRIEFKDSNPLLRGLQALGDERTNSITLIGTPKSVEIATSQLTQLDIRRRQVVVNVKIVDVNLRGNQLYNTSFSFGVGDNYFAVNDGVATLNFGGTRPPTTSEVRNSLSSTPLILNPLAEDVEDVFLGEGFFNNPGIPSADPPAGNDPLTTGITGFTPGTSTSPPRYEFSLASLYRFPRRFLASLQSEVTNGNAKILTDPTLIVQEGQTASVNLTQEVLGRIRVTTTDTAGGSREVREPEKETIGLTMAVKIERIDDNGFVSLSVAPSVKAPAGTADTGDGEIVLISERSLNSGLIRLRDGQTLILSGIIQDQDRTEITKIPILGDIPLLGSLFRRTNRTNERREVIVLLTPQVMDDSERSTYGYNYTPSPQVRDVLERRGLPVPRRQ